MGGSGKRVVMLHCPEQPVQPWLERLRAMGWEVVLTEPEDLERFHANLAPRLVLAPVTWDEPRWTRWMESAPQTPVVSYGERSRGWPLHLSPECAPRRLERLLAMADALHAGVRRAIQRERERPAAESGTAGGAHTDPPEASQPELARLMAFVDGASEAMLCIGADDRVLLCNPAAEELLGKGALALLGKPFGQVLPAWLAEGLCPPEEAGSGAWSSSIRVDGLAGELELRVRSLADAPGAGGERIAFLARSERAAASVAASWERRFTSVSASRRRSDGETASPPDAPAAATREEWEHVGRVLRGGDRLEEWIQLCSAPEEEGEFAVSEALCGLRERWEHAARARGRQLSWRVAPGVEEEQLRGSAAHLERALSELLDNAVRFTQPGKEIAFEAERRAGGVYWMIENHAPEMGYGEWERARAEFVRLQDPLDGSSPGPGLGLPIVEECLHRLGSRLGADCREDGRLSLGFWTSSVVPCVGANLQSPDRAGCH